MCRYLKKYEGVLPAVCVSVTYPSCSAILLQCGRGGILVVVRSTTFLCGNPMGYKVVGDTIKDMLVTASGPQGKSEELCPLVEMGHKQLRMTNN